MMMFVSSTSEYFLFHLIFTIYFFGLLSIFSILDISANVPANVYLWLASSRQQLADHGGAKKRNIYIYIYIESCNKTQYPITGNWQLEPIRRCIVIVASPSDIFRIYMYKAVNCASTRPAKWYTARLLTHSFTPAYRSQTLSLIIFSFSSLYAACCRSTVHHCVVLCK